MGLVHSPAETAGLLFIVAKEAAKRAHEHRGTLGEEIETFATVVLAVIVAEASINEIGHWFEFHHVRLAIKHGLPHDFEKLELRTKWSLLCVIVRQRSFDRGAEPWQSFNALVELRNAIVHLRRGFLPKGIRALLKAKGLVSSDGAIGFAVARWACETIARMFEKVTEIIEPPEDWIDTLNWVWTPRYFPRGLATPGDRLDPS